MGGAGITEEMIRRRSEHNECVLYTLEELVLQEEGIERIDTLGVLCPHLRILYMPNNLIACLENMNRLKELQYLNLAMNNIVKVEGLEHCEALEKLDLTLNFVDLQQLPSVTTLKANLHLRELFLTGNPCSDWGGYRKFVITELPHLKRLDAWEIKPTERIEAFQVCQVPTKYQYCNNACLRSSHILVTSTQMCKNDKGEAIREYSPATRVAEHKELLKLRENDNKTTSIRKEEKLSKRRNGFDPLPIEGRIYQKNEGGWEFKLHDDICENALVLDVVVGRYLDTSLIDVDVQPYLVRILVKGKLLQLHLPSEVKTDASIAQRSTTNGHLVVTMPLVSTVMQAYAPTRLAQRVLQDRTIQEPLTGKMDRAQKTSKSSIYECKQDVVDVRNIVPNTISSPMVESEQQKLIKPEPQVLNTMTATGDDDLDVPPLE
ncbi:unnamed protein product [Sphagnum troendelagicum]|uniref:Dynein axonemal assembly factor 11-like CS domain-containing protein n=1 Tax=Sphagnum troendelagicum TaxID=128251 RepID=A0ABP0UMX8_9BRYO